MIAVLTTAAFRLVRPISVRHREEERPPEEQEEPDR